MSTRVRRANYLRSTLYSANQVSHFPIPIPLGREILSCICTSTQSMTSLSVRISSSLPHIAHNRLQHQQAWEQSTSEKKSLENSPIAKGATRPVVAKNPTDADLPEPAVLGDPARIFSTVMHKLEKEPAALLPGRDADLSDTDSQKLVFPNEIILLNGAPGAGKSCNSRFILEARGLSTKPIVMSDLLAANDRFRAAIDQGLLISDADVVETLFRELLRPQYSQGVLVDGFPRTSIQADCLHLLRDKMKELRARRIAELRMSRLDPTPQRLRHPVPRFFVCILHVSEQESIRRQLKRGMDARAHNAKVREVGIGDLVSERVTDFDPALLVERYKTFERHRDTLEKLMQHFTYKIIDASADVEIVQEEILRQFQHQSKQELSRASFDAIQAVPLASRIGSNARPDLVQRLEQYTLFHPEMFNNAVKLVNTCIIPRLRSAAFAGTSTIRFPPESAQHAELSRTDAFNFRQMILDCLAERGYAAWYDELVTMTPSKFDSRTGAIWCSRRIVHAFHVEFPRAVLSNMGTRILNRNRENEEPLLHHA